MSHSEKGSSNKDHISQHSFWASWFVEPHPKFIKMHLKVLERNHISRQAGSLHLYYVYENDYKWVLNWWSYLLDSLTQCMTTLYSSLLHTHTLVVSTVTSSLPLFGSSFSFQWRTIPFLWVPDLSYQFLTATADNDWTIAVLQLTAIANWSSLQHLGMDRKENVSSIIAVFSCCCGNMRVWGVIV
jgi:hypothetical protein